MCGRFHAANTLTAAQALGASLLVGDDAPPAGERDVAPSEDAAVVVADGGARVCASYAWGWRATWARAASALVINARSEEAADKRLFVDAIRVRRCLIPATGFYEWRTEGRVKTPLRFTVPGRPVCALGGLWTDDVAPDGARRRRFLVLTTFANAVVVPVHDRMPVIVAPEDIDRWLDPATPLAAVTALFAPWPDGALRATEAVVAPSRPRASDPGQATIDFA